MQTVRRIIFCGPRDWSNGTPILEAMRLIKFKYPNAIIVHGGASGADALAGLCAKQLNLSCEVYQADWSRGKSAGPIRNEKMASLDGVIEVVAVVPKSGITKGTKSMVNIARKRGLFVREILV